MKIIVNGREMTIGKMTHVDYMDVVGMAYAGETPPRNLHTVTYQDGVNNAEGSLKLASKPVELCEGMIFNCHITNQS